MSSTVKLDYAHKGHINLTNARLYEEDGRYFLKLKYLIENDGEILELEIPKAQIHLDSIPIITCYDNKYPSYGSLYLDRIYDLTLGTNSFTLYPGETSQSSHCYYTEKRTLKKPKKMTIEEIEKKLGYKIVIVSEEEKGEKK